MESDGKLNIGSEENEEQPHFLQFTFYFYSKQQQLPSSFIDWKPEISSDPCVRMSHCLISLRISFDGVTYIPKRIASNISKSPMV